MKLTKNQKHFLKTIKDKNVRKYQKQQFKLQNQFDSVIVFSDNIFKPRNKTIGDFLSQHPLKGILFKEEFEKVNGKGFPWYEHNIKEVEERFNELAKKYMPKENKSLTQKILCKIKSDEIITREKPKGIELNKEFLQETLDKSDDLKFCQDLKNICVKFQNYEYASKFRQKERDILDTLSTEKLYELVRNGTITISDFINCEKRKSDKLVESKTVKISEFPFKTFDFSSANLSDLQIEKVIEWMNTWEQLKDTAIPIRFKEDFTNKKFEFKGFDSKNYRFSPKGEIGDKLKVEKILPKEDVDTFKKEIQSMISADISHLTFTTELNNGNFVFYKDNHKPFEYSGKISEMTFSDKLAIVEKIESYAEELDVNLKPKGKFIIPK